MTQERWGGGMAEEGGGERRENEKGVIWSEKEK